MMKNKLLLSFLISLVMFSSIGYANNYTCIDSDTSHFETTITVESDAIPISYNETCNFGCKDETGRCEPSPYEMGLIDVSVLFAILVMGIVFIYLHGKVGQEAFSLLFFLVGLMFIFASLILSIILIQESNKSVVLGSVETLVFFFEIVIGVAILLLFIFILVDGFKLIKEKNYKFW